MGILKRKNKKNNAENPTELVDKFTQAEEYFATNYDDILKAIKQDQSLYTGANKKNLSANNSEEILFWESNIDHEKEINNMRIVETMEKEDYFLKKFQSMVKKIMHDNVIFEFKGDLTDELTVDTMIDVLELLTTIKFDLFAELISSTYCVVKNETGVLTFDFYHLLNTESEYDLRALLKQYLSKKMHLKTSEIQFDVPAVKAAKNAYKIHFQIKCTINKVYERKAKIAEFTH